MTARKRERHREIGLSLQPYLCCTCDWLAGSVAASNHHLLSEEDLFRGDLDTQIATSNHDAVAGFHDFIKSTHGIKPE